MYAVIDTAATIYAAKPCVVEAIGAEVFELPCSISRFGGVEDGPRSFVNLTIESLDGSTRIEVKNVIVGDILTTERDKPPSNEEIADLDYMNGVYFDELDDKTIGILIDVSASWSWVGMEGRVKGVDDVVAMLTKWGWCLAGGNPDAASNNASEAEVCLLDADEPTLQEHIHTMFRYDFIAKGDEICHAEKIHPSVIDDYSMKQMNESIGFVDKIQHYQVALPWREGRADAAKVLKSVDSYANAKSRLMKERAKLIKDPVRRAGVFKQVFDTINEGHSDIIDSSKDEAMDGLPIWYMPMVVVTRPDKPGKFRVCLDAASKVRGIWLNGHLCTGPNQLASLPGITDRFREKRYPWIGDIRSFYHMVHVVPEDKGSFRHLFFKDESMNEIIEIQSNVHIFGAGSSPPVANYCLKFHASQMREKYGEEIFDLINRQFYVDDCIASFDTIEEARSARQRVTACLAEGGFELTKFSSCYPEILVDDVSPSSTTGAGKGPKPAVSGEKKEDSFKLRISDVPYGCSNLAKDSAIFNNVDVAEDHKDFLNPKEAALNASSKILGVGYDEQTDEFFLRISDRCAQRVTTKRGMLKLSASLYDPMGYFCAFILIAKILFQLANELGFDWDKLLTDKILDPWNEWQASIPDLAKVRIPRWSGSPEFVGSKKDLILFSDASFEAYGASAYVRRWHEDGESALVCILRAKARVVPLSMSRDKVKDQVPHDDSVPKLELNACRTAVELRTLIDEEAVKEFDRAFFFTDSSTCLIWMLDFDKKYKSFCNFRLKKIRNHSDVFNEWRWVPSDQNPADLLSHGVLASEYDKWEFLHKGPAWLSKPESFWPPKRPVMKEKPTEEEIAAIKVVADFAPSILATDIEFKTDQPDKTRCIDWVHALVRNVGNWKRKVKKIARCKKGFLGLVLFRINKGFRVDIDFTNHTTDEYNRAEIDVIRAIQMKHYGDMMEKLVRLGVTCPNARHELRQKNALSSLNPYVDENMTLRAGGRLANCRDIPADSRFPLILPKNDEDVDSLILFEHESNGHTTVNHTYHLLKRRYHIEGGRTTVNRVLSRCFACQKLEKRAVMQKMANLPVGRTRHAFAFQHCAVDAFGPFSVKWSARACHKRWVLIFVCLSTRAIDLVQVQNLSTTCTINALVIFSSRHPGVEHIYSDCGSNFKGTDRLLTRETAEFNAEKVNDYFLHENLMWHFGPPNAPHYGGSHERCVQTVKRVLKFTLEKERLELQVFETVLAKATYIVNSRPLTRVLKNTVDDFQALTPNDFLFPHVVTRSVLNLLPPISAGGDDLRDSWRTARATTAEFDDRFRKEYLLEQQKRSKWLKTQQNFRVGDLVLVIDEQVPRNEWKLARVKDIVSEGDHVRRVRVVDPARKVFERHVNSLIRLEVDMDKIESAESTAETKNDDDNTG